MPECRILAVSESVRLVEDVRSVVGIIIREVEGAAVNAGRTPGAGKAGGLPEDRRSPGGHPEDPELS